MSNCPTTGVPSQFCTCVQCQKPAEPVAASHNGENVASETETIAAQAREMVALRAEVDDMRKRLAQIRNHLVGIGGPLHDNALGYTKKQLAVFIRIEELT